MQPVFLLGAGASQPAGIPTAIEMTNRMLDLAAGSDLQPALQAVVHGLQMAVVGEKTGYDRGVDVERVINAAVQLGSRSQLEFAPFVGNWHPIIDELERRQFTARDAGRIARDAVSGVSYGLARGIHDSDFADRAIARSMESAISHALERMGTFLTTRRDGELFARLELFLTGKLMELTYLERSASERARYFDELVNSARTHVVTIATLNYDNCIESRATALDVPISTGLKEIEEENSFFPQLDSGVELLKLHGSVTWSWTTNTQGRPLLRRAVVEIPQQQIERILAQLKRADASEGIGQHLAVLFGGRSKLTGEGPYLELLNAFRQRLFKTDHLVIVGYSFRDPHVNYLIRRWLSAAKEDRITIVERAGYEPSKHPFLLEFGEILEGRFEFDCKGADSALGSYIVR